MSKDKIEKKQRSAIKYALQRIAIGDKNANRDDLVTMQLTLEKLIKILKGINPRSLAGVREEVYMLLSCLDSELLFPFIIALREVDQTVFDNTDGTPFEDRYSHIQRVIGISEILDPARMKRISEASRVVIERGILG